MKPAGFVRHFGTARAGTGMGGTGHGRTRPGRTGSTARARLARPSHLAKVGQVQAVTRLERAHGQG